MKHEHFSALSAVRAIRETVIARLEHNEDFRVLRGLEFLLATEGQRAMAQSKNEAQPISPPGGSQPNTRADGAFKTSSPVADLQHGIAGSLKASVETGGDDDHITFPA